MRIRRKRRGKNTKDGERGEFYKNNEKNFKLKKNINIYI